MLEQCDWMCVFEILSSKQNRLHCVGNVQSRNLSAVCKDFLYTPT